MACIEGEAYVVGEPSALAAAAADAGECEAWAAGIRLTARPP